MKLIRLICIAFTMLIIIMFHIPINATETNMPASQGKKQQEEQSLIIEVSGNPHEIKEKITKEYPLIDVVAVYDQLLQGLALKAKSKEIGKLARADFIKGFYPVQTYVTSNKIRFTKYHLNTNALFSHQGEAETAPIQINNGQALLKSKDESILFPEMLNDTSYTGKGIKVAVIDTGIDMNHPDLKQNYRGGFDVVDLDDNPMETTEEEGMPTSHGTHVAGIIGANGNIKGVAPEVDLYAYRALGPGGVGSSIQVIAAMEQALNDGVDIMNLSLGNTVNGPDYPTSKAVIEASKLGVAVIVANGNAGPDNWTIGAPATAHSALSVGAYAPFVKKTYLYEPSTRKKIRINELTTSAPWDLTRDYQIKLFKADEQMTNRIVLIRLGENNLQHDIKTAIDQGAVAIIIQRTEKKNEEQEQIQVDPSEIPIAVVSEKNGDSLAKLDSSQYVQIKTDVEKQIVAPFSSRGPVTVNWGIKPNIVAPGVNVLSTVPNGYDAYNGTSMAAPHVAGVVALLKEAQPMWSNEQIFGALETTAERLTDERGGFLAPFIQGNGFVRPNNAINTDVIIENGLLTFGKINRYIERSTTEVIFHNVSTKRQKVVIDLPKMTPGLNWQVPKSVHIEPNERKVIPFNLKVNELFLQEGIHEGWVHVQIENEEIPLPYIFINKTDTYKKVAGFSIRVNPVERDVYTYELYAAEKAKSVHVHLFDPETLLFVDSLLEIKEVEPGMHEGEIKQSTVKEKGMFYGLIIVELGTGEIVNYESLIYLP